MASRERFHGSGVKQPMGNGDTTDSEMNAAAVAGGRPAAGEASTAEATVEEKPHKKGIFGFLNRRFGLTGGFFVGSIFESTVVPVPIEAAMIPVMVARRDHIWRIATAVLAGCVIGVVGAYLVGVYLFEPVAQPLIDMFGVQQSFDEAKNQFEQNGMPTIILISLSPIPLVIASVGAGVTGINPVAAIGFIVATRAVRYYGIGLAAWLAGPWLKKTWRRLDNPVLKWGLILVSVLALALMFML